MVIAVKHWKSIHPGLSPSWTAMHADKATKTEKYTNQLLLMRFYFSWGGSLIAS